MQEKLWNLPDHLKYKIIFKPKLGFPLTSYFRYKKRELINSKTFANGMDWSGLLPQMVYLEIVELDKRVKFFFCLSIFYESIFYKRSLIISCNFFLPEANITAYHFY